MEVIMRYLGSLIILFSIGFGGYQPKIDDMIGSSRQPIVSTGISDRVLISAVGDIRAVLGPGKNIVVCRHGDNIAVIYGDPTIDPSNSMEIMITYSVDTGFSWTTYGPFSPELRRVYPAADGSPDFCTNPGELYFVWQESPFGYNTGGLVVVVEEGTPSAPSPSSPLSLPHVDEIFPWLASIAVNPEDPYNVIVTGLSYLNGGNLATFCWISDDGGYTWTDTIRMLDPIDTNGSSGVVRFGIGDYAFYTYHDLYDIGGGIEIIYPYYIESTNGGYTWSDPVPLPVPYVTSTSQFWWHEFDCEVIDNEPWAVHGDLDTDSIWVFHGIGTPGNWNWDVYNARQLSAESLWSGDTLYYCYPSQYPSVSFEPITNTILISFKSYYYHGDTQTWSDLDGAHIGGMYTTVNGATWQVTGPLSEPNNGEINWGDWNANEVAHRLAYVDGNVNSYGLWVNESELNLYFELGRVKPFYKTGIHEVSDENVHTSLISVAPTITNNTCLITMVLPSFAYARIKLYDAAGREVAKLHDRILETGIHQLSCDVSRYMPGVYFVHADIQGTVYAEKVIIAR
jgi:hypothetical protein